MKFLLKRGPNNFEIWLLNLHMKVTKVLKPSKIGVIQFEFLFALLSSSTFAGVKPAGKQSL